MTARHIITGLACLCLLAGCNSEPGADAEARDAAQATAPQPALATKPDPGKCPPPETPYDPFEFGPREAPLTVATSIAAIAATDGTNLAVTRLGGGQLCHDVSWMYNFAKDSQTYANGRFVAIGYDGYEAFGTLLFDRAGSGPVLDTGNPPVFSPSGRLMAGLELTESGFGGLESFVIWQVEPGGLTERHRMADGESLLAGDIIEFEAAVWRGEDCLDIAAYATEDLAAVDWDKAKARRTPFHAARGNGWRITAGSCPA